MILLPWSYDMMSLVILMCCVHKYDYLHAHLFNTGGNKWFLIPMISPSSLLDVTLLLSISTISLSEYYTMALHVWNSIQFRSHLGNLLSTPKGTCVYCSIVSLIVHHRKALCILMTEIFPCRMLADFQHNEIHSILIAYHFFDYIQWALKCLAIYLAFMIWPTWECVSA